MKHGSCLLALAFVWALGAALQPATAADKTWTGASSSNWSDAGNWSGGKPGSGDVAVFDGTSSVDCNVDENINVQGLRVNAGYGGTLTQGAASTMTIGTNHAIFAAGTFVGSADITINGCFTNSGTAFTAPSGKLYVKRGFVLNGGSFTHNNGTVEFGSGSYKAGWDTRDAGSLIITSGAVFNDVIVNAVANYTRSVADDMDVRGGLIHAGGYINATLPDLSAFATSTITVKGEFITKHSNVFGKWGRLQVLLDDTADQVVSQLYANSECYLIVSKPSGVVRALSDVKFAGVTIGNGNTLDMSPDGGTTSCDLTIGSDPISIFTNAGTFYARAGTHRFGVGNDIVPFYNTGTYEVSNSITIFGGNGFGGASGNRVPLVSGGITFNNVTNAHGANHYRELYDDLHIDGDLHVLSGSMAANSGWRLFLTGDYVHPSVYSPGGWNQTMTFVFSGTSPQQIDIGSGAQSRAHVIVTNGATLVLATNLTLAAGRATTVSHGGALDLNGYNLASASGFTVNGTLRMRGDETTTSPTVTSGSTVSYYGIDGTPVTVNNWSYQTLEIDGPGREFQFTAGTTYTVAEAFNANGEGDLILLRSTSDGTQWNIDTATATKDIWYVDVKDSVSTAPTVITARHSHDSGNNIRWNIIPEPKGTVLLLQ